LTYDVGATRQHGDDVAWRRTSIHGTSERHDVDGANCKAE
jgi:hypothetical protein